MPTVSAPTRTPVIAPVRYITDQRGLQAWVDHCRQCTLVGVDTESDSAFRYQERTCLLQMSAGGEDALVDPLALDHLEPLRPLFAAPYPIKVFHDASGDVLGLLRDFQFEVAGIFDTMLAARLLGERQFGLAHLLEQHFAHQSNKRLQRSDWSKRPLTTAQLEYARYDSHFLPALRQKLLQQLVAKNRLYWAEEEFSRLFETATLLSNKLQITLAQRRAHGFWNYAPFHNLSPHQQRIFAALWRWREQTAQRLDRPVFRVANDKLLLQVVQSQAPTAESAGAGNQATNNNDPEQETPVLPAGFMRRFGHELRRLVHYPPVLPPRPPHLHPLPRLGRAEAHAHKKRFDQLRSVRRRGAEALQLDPEVLLSNALLKSLAAHPPTSPAQLLGYPVLQGWRAPWALQYLWPQLPASQAPQKPSFDANTTLP